MNITALQIKVESVGIREASNALGGLSTSATNAERRITNLITAVNKLQTASVNLASATKSQLAQLQQQTNLMNSLHGSVSGAASSMASLAQATTLLAAALAALNAQQQLVNRQQQQHNQGMREAHALARGLSGSLGMLWMTYGNLAGMAVGIAIGASLKAVVKNGMEVEHTLEAIRVRGQESVESINKMRDAVLDLGKGVYGPQQVANAFETLILAGLNAEQALNSVSAALNLATVGGTSIEKSAQTLVSVGSSIGYAAEGFSRIGDVISKTAALSMSSVETLSEAFKSASSVSKLYGVSLEDIATSLGVLSNLGIQGSAAGTALKNMYKELASEADKVQNTFKKMGVNMSSIQNADGSFKPLVEVIGQLDTALTKLTPTEEKLAIARLSNERGMRLLVQALDLYRQKTKDGGNALEEFRKQAENSYGFAALGAVQMAMTAKSQVESMGNTLKTVFVETFREVEPEIVLFTQNMKAAFMSAGFKEGILTISKAFGTMALAISENLPLLTKLIGMFIAFKAAIMIGSLLTGIAEGLTAISVAMRAAAAGTLTLTTAMAALTPVLVILTAAWVAYELARDNAISEKDTQVAAAYSKSLIDGMIKESEQLKRQTELIKEKMSASQAAKKAEQESAAAKMFELDKTALAVAREETEAYRRSNNSKKYAEGLATIAKLEERAANNKKLYAAAQTALTNSAKEHAEAVQKQSRNNPGRPDPTSTLGGDPDRGVVNDRYAAAILAQDSLIRKARRSIAAEEEKDNLLVKAGKMGRIQMIEEMGKLEVQKYGEIQDAIAQKLAAARGKGDRSEVQRFLGEQEQAQEDLQNKLTLNEASRQLALQRAAEEYTDFRIAQLEREGAYSTAAHLKFQKEHKAAFESARLDAEKYGKDAYILIQNLEAKQALQKQVMKDALNKEAVKEFADAAEATRNALKGVQTASEGQGLAAMFNAATEASRRYQADLPMLREKMKLMTNLADINEAQARLTNLAENQRKMWVGIGDSIGESLENAFGRGGDAMGRLFGIAVDYNNLENKTGKARVKTFGDAAGAAKGFFKEGTAGYKAMENAEKAFRLLEMANMAKSLATSLFVTSTKTTTAVAGQAVETSAVVAGEATRNAAKVPGVYMAFMSALGPWGMAAAGVAIAAVLGSAFGGKGGGNIAEQRQKTQGTGSVLGAPDTKSESIARSIEHLERNSGLGLIHSNEMVKSLKAIQNGITGLASFIVSSTGLSGKGYQSSEKKSMFDSKVVGTVGAIGGAAGGAMLGSFLGPLGMIAGGLLGALGGSFLGKIAGSIFGGKVTNQDVGFTIGKTSLGGAMAGGINAMQYADMKKDGGWFRSDKHYTNTTSMGAEANSQFSKIITSMAESLKAAGKLLGVGGDEFSRRLNSFVIDIGKISLKDMSGEQVEKELQAVFSKLGDDMARWALGGFQQFQKVGEGYLETVARVASNLVQVRDVFAVLGKSLNATGASAVFVSESLVELAGGIENLTEGTKFFVENFLTQAERMGPIVNSVRGRMAELNIGHITTMELYKQKIQSLNLMNEADRRLYVAMIELAPAFKDVAEYVQDVADGTVALTKAQERALDRINDARSTLQDAYDKEKDSLQSVIDKTKSFIETLSSYKDSLKLGADSPFTNMQKYDESRHQLESVATKALAGDQAAKDKFTSIANSFLAASKVINASGGSYTADFNYVQSLIDKLSNNAQGELNVAEASLAALERQVAGLLEVNKSVLTVAQAVVNLQSALIAGREAGLTYTQMGLDPRPNQPLVSVTNSQQNNAMLVQAVHEVRAEISTLREEQKAQVGAQIGAAYKSGDGIADMVSTLQRTLQRNTNDKVYLA